MAPVRVPMKVLLPAGLATVAVAALAPRAVWIGVSILLVIGLGVLIGLAARRRTEIDATAAALREQADALRASLDEQEALHRDLRVVATHDPLTGLGNRALLGETLSELLDAGSAEGADAPPVSLLLL